MAKQQAQASTLPTELTTEAPAVVEKPSEEEAAVALRDRFTAFTATTATRTTITDSDRAALAEIESLHAAYQEQARQAWGRMEWGTATTPDLVTLMGFSIAEYKADCLDEQVIALASMRHKTFPAIESATFRAALVRDGKKIIEQIGAAISAGYARIATAQKLELGYTDNVRRWLTKYPVVRQMVATIITTNTENPDALNLRGGLLQALRSQVEILAHAEERATGKDAVRLYAHERRRWIPIATAILTETPDRSAA